MALHEHSPGERSNIVMERYKKAQSAKQPIIQKMIELDKFDRGEQWQGEIPAWVPKPVTNYIHLVKTTQRANLALENQTALLRPTHPDDTEHIQDLQDILDCVWYKTDARMKVRSSIESALLLGTAVAQVYWDDSIIGGRPPYMYKGDIKIKEIDPANVFPDPNAYRLEDCTFVHTTELVDLNWVQNEPRFIKYLGGRQALMELKSNQQSMNDSEIYNRPSPPDMQNGELTVLHTHWERVRNMIGQYQLNVYYVVNGLEVYSLKDVKPSMYPFAVLYDYPQRKSFWGKSTSELILENQKIVNKVEQVASLIGTLMQNPQKEVLKQSGIDPNEVSRKGNLAGKVWVSNIPDGIRNIEPPQIPTGLFTLAEQARNNIKEIAGLNEAYMGESVGSLTTSTGVNSLIERATIRDRDKMIEIEDFVRQIVDLILQFVVTNYQEPRYIRIVGDDGSSAFKRFTGASYKDIQYDIHVDVSGKMPTTRALLAQQARDLMNMQGQFQFNPPVITPEEMIDMLDIRNSERIKSRMKEDRLEAQMQPLQMIKDSIAQGLPPEKVLDMVTQMLAQKAEGTAAGNVAENKPHSSDSADMTAKGNMQAGR